MPRVSRLLDRLYDAAGYAAAGAVVMICAVVGAQVALNAAARVGGAGWAATIPSYADVSGFLLAAASFLALAHTLRRGGHIRVTLAAGRLAPRPRWLLECATLGLATAVAGFVTLHAGRLAVTSWRFGDTSPGLLPVPLWIPQLPVCLGLALLTLALAHTLAEALIARRPVLGTDDEGAGR